MKSTADNACLSCAQKKRKCDRKLPACSSCEKQSRECWYRTASAVSVEAVIPGPAGEDSHHQTRRYVSAGLAITTNQQPDKSLFPYHSHSQVAIFSLTTGNVKLVGACLRCRSRKKKCDKTQPRCSRCSRHQVRCVYPEGITNSNDPSSSFLSSLDVRGVDATVPLPVASRPYMPMLLHSFTETFGMDPLPVDNSSLAWALRAVWIQQALADPCAFHTTLFAASAHLDAFRGVKDNYMTLYHHTMALRLINEKLAAPDAVLSEPIMACVAPLIFFSSLTGEKDSSQIHKKALMRMIKAKGGLNNLELDRFLSGLITVCVLTEAIINDSDLDIPFLEIKPTPPSPPRFFSSAILRRAATKTGYYNLSQQAVRIFEDIDFVSRYLADPSFGAASQTDMAYERIMNRWQVELEKVLFMSSHNPQDPHMVVSGSGSDAIYQACHATALIFWYLIDDFFPFSPDELRTLVAKLKAALLHGNMDTWVKAAPEAHTFACLFGAAAATDPVDRAWFSLRHGQPVICIQSQGPSIFLESWDIFDWANNRRKLKMLAPLEQEEEAEEEKEDDAENQENEPPSQEVVVAPRVVPVKAY